MAEFSFGFTEGSFLQLKGQKHLKSIAEDLISNMQKERNEFIKNDEGTVIKNSQANIFQQVITCQIICNIQGTVIKCVHWVLDHHFSIQSE